MQRIEFTGDALEWLRLVVSGASYKVSILVDDEGVKLKPDNASWSPAVTQVEEVS